MRLFSSIVSKMLPRRLFSVAYTPPITSDGPAISTRKIGSWKRGSAHS